MTDPLDAFEVPFSRSSLFFLWNSHLRHLGREGLHPKPLAEFAVLFCVASFLGSSAADGFVGLASAFTGTTTGGVVG